MTMIEIRLPDELARRARNAGLLSDDAVQGLLEDAMRRRAGRASWMPQGASNRPAFRP